MLLLTLRFAVELAGVAAVGVAASTLTDTMPWRLILGIGAALAFVVVWGIVVAPKATNPLPQPVRDLIGTGALLLAAVALGATGHPALAVALGAVVLVDQVLLIVVRPELPEAIRAAGGRD
jgi:hypothetical protein